MAIDEFQKQKVIKLLSEFCNTRVPDRVKDKIKLDFEIIGNNVTLFERRKAYFDETKWSEMKIAQFRYDSDKEKWSLYWLRHIGKWHIYDEIDPATDIQVLIDEVKKDPLCVFWG
ncbi:Protein of unknown function [Dethiosulfatibacter aminovorans DSM 17477]|uniref:DUF3024 domain-containing protein n=1 Tax=Dethiosulfatibacter aminovorans DSM 17477 TaxID=1121476 RepID=A0A1M6ME60_9FIRM|nr:DUF3024 domain-containing protein [Dethiosulfatibacter aminovorans]SHJ81738.1 Protein of unknown function [Dethiosulfatibacter aminovorans DSM 17477]